MAERTVTQHGAEDCYQKATRRGQATFTLVAQDVSSPGIIVEWIKANIQTAPPAKLYEALSKAIEMSKYPEVRRAD